MKKIKSIFLIFSLFLLCGFTLPDNNTYSKIVPENDNYINNPEYIEYNSLSKKEKDKIDVIPLPHINYFDVDEVLNNDKPDLSIKSFVSAVGSSLPSSYDLRNYEVSPAVKDQGNLNICWAFASNSSLESNLKKYKGTTYNFSENQPEYVARFLKDSSVFGQSNSLLNVIKYWFYGYTPVTESYFGSYFQTYKDIATNKIINTDNTSIDVQNVTVFPSLMTKDILNDYKNGKYTKSQIESVISEYTSSIKTHIMNNGAIFAPIYTAYFDTNTNFVYDDGAHTKSGYKDTAHAITIIGWDDNYGNITVNGSTFTGSWIGLNSWGNKNTYFYISYYDVEVVSAIIGVVKAETKEWDNSYITNLDYSTSGVTSEIYNYYVGEDAEELKSVKVFYSDSDLDSYLTVQVTSNGHSMSSTRSITYGINTFTFNNFEVKGDVKVTLSASGILGKQHTIGLFTKEKYSNSNVYLVEDKYNNFNNNISNKLKYHLITKNINPGTSYTIKVYDESGSDVTSSFTQTKSDLISNYATFTLKQTKALKSAKARVVVTISGVSKTINYNIDDLEGSGTASSPYIINSPSDLVKMNGSSSYFKLVNNIDLKYTTTSTYGIYNTDGYGWSPISFNGTLDGNNYKILNLNSSKGGLFDELTNATIKNLILENFSIYNATGTYASIGVLANSAIGCTFNKITVTNAYVNSNSTGGILFGILGNSKINDIKLNGLIYASITGGGLAGTIILSEKNDLRIDRLYIDSSTISGNKNKTLGYLAGQLTYIADVDAYLPIIYLSNINISSVTSSTTYNTPSNLIEFVSSSVTSNGKVLSDFDIESVVSISSCYILGNSDRTNTSYFSGFTTSPWSFTTSSSAYITDHNKTSSATAYITSSNYTVLSTGTINMTGSKTTVNTFKEKINYNSNLTYNYYDKTGAMLSSTSYVGTGSYVEVCNEITCKGYVVILKGDVNGDGKISIQDVIKVADYALADSSGKSKLLPSTYEVNAADFDTSNKINIQDVIKIADSVLAG